MRVWGHSSTDIGRIDLTHANHLIPSRCVVNLHSTDEHFKLIIDDSTSKEHYTVQLLTMHRVVDNA